MNSGPELTTKRLLLRRWRETDRQPFASLNADRRVMEFFPRVLTTEESNDIVDRIEQHFEDHRFGFWAVEVFDGPPFVGFVGLARVRFEAHFTPCIEIGWRLDAEQWGHGYATEAARAALAFGFDRLTLPEIVAFTVPANHRSRRVMERLGLTHDPCDDFQHPDVPEHMKCHVLYRIQRSSAQQRAAPDGGRCNHFGRW